MTNMFDGFTFLSAGVAACAVWLSFLVIKALRVSDGRDRWDVWGVLAGLLTVGSLALLAYGLVQGWANRDSFTGPAEIGTLPWLALRWLLAPGVWLGIVLLPMQLLGIAQRLRRPTLRKLLPLTGVGVILYLGHDPRLLGLAMVSALVNLTLYLYDDRRRVAARQ